MAFLAELRPKRSASKKRLLLFGKNGHKKNKKSAEYWHSVVFTDETQVKLTSDGIVRVFAKKHSLCAKKRQKCDTDRRSLIFWVCKSIGWPENVV